MSSGLDDLGDLLDDPGYKAWMRGGGGGGGGGGVIGGPGAGGGGGFISYAGAPTGIGMNSTDPATGKPRKRKAAQHPGTARLAASYGVQPAFDEGATGHAAPITPLAGATPAGRGAAPATGSGNPTWDLLMSTGRSPFLGSGARRNPLGSGAGAPTAPRVPTGANTGPKDFNPDNPWGHLTGNTDTSPEGIMARLLGQGGAAGAFDPSGGEYLGNLEAAGRSTIDNWERGTTNELSALGLDDPSLYTAMLSGERADQGRALNNNLTNIRGQWAGNQADYIRSLLSGALGQQWNHYNTQYAHSLQDDGGTDWGGILGGIGSIAGAFI